MNDILKSHFLSLYSMVIADGEIAPEEKIEMYRIGREFYDLSQDEINKVITQANGSLIIKPQSKQERIRFLYNLALIANADGVIQPEERYLLKKYVKEFDFKEENVDKIVDFLLIRANEKVSPEEIIKMI